MDTCILFVDDEPKILEGLRRTLRGMRREWTMMFANGGDEALDILAQHPVDVIVSDMRMPGIDGAKLLDEVRKRYPHIIRMVLSGQCDQDTLPRVIGSSHQFLSKPCDIEVLARSVRRTLALRDRLRGEDLKALVAGLPGLPTPSEVYQQLVKELNAPEPDAHVIGTLIERDVALCAKVLQLANSGYFNLARAVTTPMQAVNLLGLDTVGVLIMSQGVLAAFEDQGVPVRVSREVSAHSMTCARLAQEFAKLEGFEARFVSYAFVAGMLHDVGSLALASGGSQEYVEIWEAARRSRTWLYLEERTGIGNTHAEVGAYLLSLWGLPTAVVDAIAFHHEPAEAHASSIDVLTAVHVAEVMLHLHKLGDGQANLADKLDRAYLEQIGAGGRVERWGQILKAFLPRETR